MKLYLKLFLIVVIFISCGSSECREFKTGTFKNFENGKWTNTKITRTSEYQIEYNSETNIETKDKIVWIDDCTYKLISVSVNNKIVSTNVPNLIIQITNTGKDYYELAASVEGEEPSYWSKMVRLE